MVHNALTTSLMRNESFEKTIESIKNPEIQIKTKFGVDFEVHRIKQTLQKLEWFEKNGYKPNLPDGVSVESSENDILESVQVEFDESEYTELSERFQNEFSEIAENLNEVLADLFGVEIPTDYNVFLTKYGVGGSYGLPNNIVFNIYNKNGLKIIFHEIVHLLIEENIQKYEIEHWEKERIVDLILNSEKFTFLKYDRWQKKI